MTFSSIRQSWYSRLISFCLMITFVGTMVISPKVSFAQAIATKEQGILGLPQPGVMVDVSPAYVPLMITGLSVHPENPLLMDFIVNTGNSGMTAYQVKKESDRLIKYFLACLTIPENNQWVNLSPYEKQRIVPEDLGKTVLGQDMLAQDYLLKQLTASLVYPEKNLGKDFWNKVYAKASQEYGTAQVPVNTFNKVWILPDTAKVYEHKDTVFVVKSHLKVMLDEDYLSLQKHSAVLSLAQRNDTHSIGANIVRQIILPAIEQEVNHGKNFAQLRQIYNSMILAVWFKNNLKQALLNQVYTNRSKVNGVNVDDPSIKEQIYQQYLKAYKKGVFNYIKEEVDQTNQQVVPRKYFSGGLTPVTRTQPATPDEAMQAFSSMPGENFRVSGLTQGAVGLPVINPDAAMSAELKEKLAVGYGGVGLRGMEDRIEQGVFNERQMEVLDVLLQEGAAQSIFGDWEEDAVGFENDQKIAMLNELIALEDGILKEFGGIQGYIRLEEGLAKRAQEGFNPVEGKKIETPEGAKLTVINREYFEKGRRGLAYLNRVAFQKVAAGNAQRLSWNGPQADLPYDVLAQDQRGGKSFIQEDIESILALQEQYKEETGQKIHVPYVLYLGQEYIEQIKQYLTANNYFGMNGVSVVDPNKGIEEGKVLNQIVLTWQTKALGFKDRVLTKEGKYKLSYQPLGHGWVHPDLGKIGLTQYFTEKLGPESRTIFFQASNPLIWNGVMQTIDEAFTRDDDLNVTAVSVRPGDTMGRLVMANGELTNVEYNYFNSHAVHERLDNEGNSEYGGNINVFVVKNAPYLEIVNNKDNWVEVNGQKISKVFAWLYNPKPKKVIRPETNMQDIYRFFKKVGVTILDRSFVFAAVKNDLVEAQKQIAKNIFPEDTMSVLGLKWCGLRRILAEFGLKFTDLIEGEKQKLFFKGEGDRLDMGTEWYDGAKISINPQWKYTFANGKNVATKNAVLVLDNVSKSGVGDRSVEFRNVTFDGTLIIRAVSGVSLKVHDFDFGTKDRQGRSTIWHFEPLSLKQILAKGKQQYTYSSPLSGEKTIQDISPVEQKSGYVLVKDGPGWIFEINRAGKYEIGSDGQLRRLDQAMNAQEIGHVFIDKILPEVQAGKAAEILIKPDATKEQAAQAIEFLRTKYDVELSPVTVTLTEAQIDQWYLESFKNIRARKSAEEAEKDISAVKGNMVGKPLRVLIVREKNGASITFNKEQAQQIGVQLYMDQVKADVRAMFDVKRTDSLNKFHFADSKEAATKEIGILRAGIMTADAAMKADQRQLFNPNESAVESAQIKWKQRDAKRGKVIEKDLSNRRGKDRDAAALAQPYNGGIDLNSKNLNMQSEGEKVNITFDTAMIAQFKRGDFSGVKFQIIDVVQIDPIPLLGLK